MVRAVWGVVATTALLSATHRARPLAARRLLEEVQRSKHGSNTKPDGIFAAVAVPTLGDGRAGTADSFAQRDTGRGKGGAGRTVPAVWEPQHSPSWLLAPPDASTSPLVSLRQHASPEPGPGAGDDGTERPTRWQLLSQRASTTLDLDSSPLVAGPDAATSRRTPPRSISPAPAAGAGATANDQDSKARARSQAASTARGRGLDACSPGHHAGSDHALPRAPPHALAAPASASSYGRAVAALEEAERQLKQHQRSSGRQPSRGRGRPLEDAPSPASAVLQAASRFSMGTAASSSATLGLPLRPPPALLGPVAAPSLVAPAPIGRSLHSAPGASSPTAPLDLRSLQQEAASLLQRAAGASAAHRGHMAAPAALALASGAAPGPGQAEPLSALELQLAMQQLMSAAARAASAEALEEHRLRQLQQQQADLLQRAEAQAEAEERRQAEALLCAVVLRMWRGVARRTVREAEERTRHLQLSRLGVSTGQRSCRTYVHLAKCACWPIHLCCCGCSTYTPRLVHFRRCPLLMQDAEVLCGVAFRRTGIPARPAATGRGRAGAADAQGAGEQGQRVLGLTCRLMQMACNCMTLHASL